MKRCSKCCIEKPEKAFSFIQSRQQYFPWCLECKRADLRQWRSSNPRPLKVEPIVYRICNVVNGKAYIGVTHRPFGMRMAEHVRHSKAGSRFPVHSALRKYGVEHFTFEIIERLTDIAGLEAAEKKHVAAHNSMVPHGYNRTVGGNGMCGLRQSDEVRHAHSVRHTGYRHTPEAIEKIRAASIGRKMPREAVESAKSKRTGAKRTTEQCARISAGRMGKGLRNKASQKYSDELIVGAIARVRAGEKQGLVAREVGIHQAYLSQLLSGRRGVTRQGTTQ